MKAAAFLIAALLLAGCSSSTPAPNGQTTLACGAVQFSASGPGAEIPESVLKLCEQLINRDGEVAKARIEKEKR